MEIPRTIIEVEADGSVRLEVGDQIGWVSSHHLAGTKERQLVQAWVDEHRHRPRAPGQGA